MIIITSNKICTYNYESYATGTAYIALLFD